MAQFHPYRNLIPKICELLAADSGVTDIFKTNIYEAMEPDEYFEAHTITPFINIFAEVREIENEVSSRRDGDLIVNVDVVYNRDMTDMLNRYDGAYEVERVLADDANKTLLFTVDRALYDSYIEVPAIDISKQKQILGIAFKYKYYQDKN